MILLWQSRAHEFGVNGEKWPFKAVGRNLMLNGFVWNCSLPFLRVGNSKFHLSFKIRLIEQRKYSVGKKGFELRIQVLFMINISEADTATAVHVVLILVCDNDRVIFFFKPSFGNFNSTFLYVVAGLDHLTVYVKCVEFFACKVQVGVWALFLIVKVETHFHESIVNFSRAEIYMKWVLDRLGFNKGLTCLRLLFG